MNEERVSLAKVVTALKQEAYRQKSRHKDTPTPASASVAKSNKPSSKPADQQPPRTRFCTSAKKRAIPSATFVERGRTSAAPLGGASFGADTESDFSGSELKVTTGNVTCSLSAFGAVKSTGDANLDSGCLMSTTPDISSVQNPRPDHTPVRLADHSVVEATHLGTMSLPIDGDTPIKSLVVQSLHKPLVSIANLCNADLTVVFTKSSCNIYSTSGFKPHGKLAGRGYRRGNLYYLPEEPVSSESVSSSIVSVFDNTLLGYHHCFSHIGLRALKTLLREHKITPSDMNEIAVQQCPTCVQSKMHRTAFKSRSAYRSNAPGQLIHSDVGS
ncbi:hypothetical protein PCASD_26608 [Puccinia coronata f. sp. avenae]|uniref:GAG-pre-integrase domain-containing protein n=1 Tax=Puccinia coronata f. sp. avenae TaxID=200324 RepID=A0A2N5RTZ5_9BASI|nr:hypothetical protein PCASD_26608 [Puccinia coronata f. sp. avenae]